MYVICVGSWSLYFSFKQRKPEDGAEGEVKKVKGEKGEALSITNGTEKCVNGQPKSMKTEENKVRLGFAACL